MGRGVTQNDAVVGSVGVSLRRRFAVAAAAASLSLRLQHDKRSLERNAKSLERNNLIKFIDKDFTAIKLVAGNHAVTDI